MTMTLKRATSAILPLAIAAALAGCANDGSLFGDQLTTASVTPPAKIAAAPKVDPVCVALSAKIDSLRQDGVADRIAKVSTGKSKTVSVKRDSLAKISELDATNKEFQAKCSTLQPPRQQSAAALPPNVSIISNPNQPAATKATAQTAATAAARAATAN
jgi:hypothetical protein